MSSHQSLCARANLAALALAVSGCAAQPPVFNSPVTTVDAKHFATVYNAVLDATEISYPTYREDARAGRVATAWHIYRSVYTDPGHHHAAWFGSWRPPRAQPALFVRMRVHVVGGTGAWKVIIIPQASYRSLGNSPRAIPGVPYWLAVEAEKYRRRIERAIQVRSARDLQESSGLPSDVERLAGSRTGTPNVVVGEIGRR